MGGRLAQWVGGWDSGWVGGSVGGRLAQGVGCLTAVCGHSCVH